MTGAGTVLPFRARAIVTVTVMLTTIMQALDSTIANVALPRMQGALSATQDQMVWVLTSYIVAAAITIPLIGWLATRYDRKIVFLASIAGFTFASALCGISATLPQIVAARLLQGISGAALVPLSQTILFEINPPANYGRAMAVWGVGSTLGPILGPVLGGWLTDDYNWRWVFYINLPVGVAAFLGLWLFLPSRKSSSTKPFDFFGFVTLAISIGALQLMLDRGQLKDWFSSTEIVAEGLLSATAFYLFVIHTLTHRRPFLNPAIFRDRNFLLGNMLMFAVGISLFSTLTLVPPMLQNLMGYPVVTTGLVIAPRGAGMMAAMFLVGPLTGRVDSRNLMGAGLALTALSLWQMTHFSLQMDMGAFVTSSVIQGVGIGLVWVPLSTAAFATLAPELRVEGTALFALLRNIASSLGISAMQVLLVQNTEKIHAAMVGHVSMFDTTTNPALIARHLMPDNVAGWLALDHEIYRQAAMIGYLDDFYFVMILSLCVAPLIPFFRGVRVPTKSHAMGLE